MRTGFFGLAVGLRALMAQQQALDTTGHNIANANTEGYTRQRVELQASRPITEVGIGRGGYAQVGTGAELARIVRTRDAFLDQQVRNELAALGEWETRDQALQEVEVIFSEPAAAGLRSVLDEYWQAWQNLSNDPANPAARETVIQRASAVTETLGHIDRQLTDLQRSLSEGVKAKVNELNLYARQIADLNRQIVKLEAGGNPANDLRDQRDLLVDRMSKLAKVRVRETPEGSLTVSLGSGNLVSYDKVNSLEVVPDGQYALGTGEAPRYDTKYKIQFSETQQAVTIEGGSIAGYVAVRDELVQGYRQELYELAQRFVDATNNQHQLGENLVDQNQRNFFTATDGSTWDFATDGTDSFQSLSVNPEIVNNPDLIAAADPGAGQGNGGNALKIAKIKTDVWDADYRALISKLGIDAQDAERLTGNQETLLAQLEQQRQSVSGVNLDEEMANMVRYQHAYNAAARLITTVDEMLETVINRMGMTGR